MSIQQLREVIQDYAKDTRLNLGSVLSKEGAPGLTENQIMGIALACAYSTRSERLIGAMEAEAGGILSSAEVDAAKAASSIMAMNNIYYRFIHLAEDEELKNMPAKLRMNVIGRPGVDKKDFELYSLAISALNGCGMCIQAHVNELKKVDVSKEGIQSSVRIAAVINAAAQALSIG